MNYNYEHFGSITEAKKNSGIKKTTQNKTRIKCSRKLCFDVHFLNGNSNSIEYNSSKVSGYTPVMVMSIQGENCLKSKYRHNPPNFLSKNALQNLKNSK